MKIIYSEKHATHDPQTFFVRGVKQRSAEQPERATRLLAAAKGAEHEVIAPRTYGVGPAASVHTPEYLDFLQTVAQEWSKFPNASAEVVPNVHPARYPATYPKALAAAPAGIRSTSPARSGRAPGMQPWRRPKWQ